MVTSRGPRSCYNLGKAAASTRCYTNTTCCLSGGSGIARIRDARMAEHAGPRGVRLQGQGCLTRENPMRTVAVLGALATALLIDAGSAAQAARWCGQAGASQNCSFQSYRACARALGNGGYCRRQVAARAPAPYAAPPSEVSVYGWPQRPAWSSPYECYYDDGYGRYRPCNAGGDGGSRQ
jgi:hypothetical protein